MKACVAPHALSQLMSVWYDCGTRNCSRKKMNRRNGLIVNVTPVANEQGAGVNKPPPTTLVALAARVAHSG